MTWVRKTFRVDFVTGAFAVWLIEQLADAGRKHLSTFLLGTEQERALQSAGTAAIRLTAQRFGSGDAAKARDLVVVFDQVFAARMPAADTYDTLLEALHAGITAELAPLADVRLTETSHSSAELLGISMTDLA